MKANFKILLNHFLFLVFVTACNEPTQPEVSRSDAAVTESEQVTVPKKQTNENKFKNNIATEISKVVISILQDRNNNYWFGTNEGVYRYDGTSLILFTTQDGLFQNQVQDIQEDKVGNIWFATGGYGVNRFDGQKITTLTAKKQSLLESSSLSNWKIEDGDLWFYAGGGAFHYSNDSFTYLPFPKPAIDYKYSPAPPYQFSSYGVYSILKDRRGTLWFGTQAMGVCRYDGKSFTWFREQGLGKPAVLALLEDRNGILWFGNNGNGLFRYDGKTLTNVTAEKGLSNPEFMKSGKQGPGTLARIWALNEDNNGNIFIGTGDAGVWRFDGRELTNYTTMNGLPDKGIETIYKDKKGELWFGTNGAGVYKFNGTRFAKFTIQQLAVQPNLLTPRT